MKRLMIILLESGALYFFLFVSAFHQSAFSCLYIVFNLFEVPSGDQ